MVLTDARLIGRHTATFTTYHPCSTPQHLTSPMQDSSQNVTMTLLFIVMWEKRKALGLRYLVGTALTLPHLLSLLKLYQWQSGQHLGETSVNILRVCLCRTFRYTRPQNNTNERLLTMCKFVICRNRTFLPTWKFNVYNPLVRCFYESVQNQLNGLIDGIVCTNKVDMDMAEGRIDLQMVNCAATQAY